MQRTRTNRDGSITVQKPHRHENGYHVLIKVDTLSEVERLFEEGDAIGMRMSGDGEPASLVVPDKYK